MAYIAQKRMKVDETRYVEHGEPIDVSTWQYNTIASYERQGLIKEVPNVAPQTPAKTRATK